jgi:hypothetical protein
LTTAGSERPKGEKPAGERPLPVIYNWKIGNGSGLLSVDLAGETGNFTGSGPFMEHPFFGRLVDGGFGCVQLFGCIALIMGDGEAHILDNVFDPGLNRFVPQPPTFVLPGAFQC